MSKNLLGLWKWRKILIQDYYTERYYQVTIKRKLIKNCYLEPIYLFDLNILHFAFIHKSSNLYGIKSDHLKLIHSLYIYNMYSCII